MKNNGMRCWSEVIIVAVIIVFIQYVQFIRAESIQRMLVIHSSRYNPHVYPLPAHTATQRHRPQASSESPQPNRLLPTLAQPPAKYYYENVVAVVRTPRFILLLFYFYFSFIAVVRSAESQPRAVVAWAAASLRGFTSFDNCIVVLHNLSRLLPA